MLYLQHFTHKASGFSCRWFFRNKFNWSSIKSRYDSFILFYISKLFLKFPWKLINTLWKLKYESSYNVLHIKDTQMFQLHFTNFASRKGNVFSLVFRAWNEQNSNSKFCYGTLGIFLEISWYSLCNVSFLFQSSYKLLVHLRKETWFTKDKI